MKLSREAVVAIALGALVLAVPPFLVPYPPFHDLIAFVGMQSYPPKLSHGPTHYYTFQLTYFLHHVISRVSTDLGIGTQGQSRLFYLMHALGYFAVIAGLLNRFVRNPRWKAVAILGGALAFTDGMFAIGGPLAFSLAGVLIMILVLLISEARETDRVPSMAALLALAFLAMLSHPFSVPFLLAVFVVSFAVTPRQRITSAVAIGFVLFYALLIGRDSPESVPPGQLWQLFDPNLPHVWRNLVDALTWDARYIYRIFQEPMPVVNAYVYAIAAIKLLGVLLAVAACRRLWRNPSLRFLLLLEVAFVALFATAVDAETGYIVPQWPWRVWSIGNPILYCFPIIAVAELAGSIAWPRFFAVGRTGMYGALAGLAVLLLFVQYQVMQPGRKLQSSFQSLKSTVLQSGARDAVVTWAGSTNTNPFFLRSAPYLLFSDADMLARNLLFVTDWHVQPRHNSHMPETSFPSARPRLVLEFLPSNRDIVAQVRGVQPRFPVKVRFGDRIPRTGAGEPILTTGKPGDANFLLVLAPTPGTIVFYLDAWGSPWAASPPVPIDPNREYRLDIGLGGPGIKLQLDGTTIWERNLPVRSLDNPEYGRNSVGGTTTMPTFSGTVTPIR